MIFFKTVLSITVSLFAITSVFAHVSFTTSLKDKSYQPGQQIDLRWQIDISHNQEDWDLEYTIDGGDSWIEIVYDLPTERLEFPWRAPDIQSNEVVVRIIQDNVGTDYYADTDKFSIGSMTTAVNDVEVESKFNLSISPNPIQVSSIIDFQLPKSGSANLTILDLKGRKVQTIYNQHTIQGAHIVNWATNSIPNGIYIVRISADGYIENKKVVIAR